MKNYLKSMVAMAMAACLMTGSAFAFTYTEIDTEQAFDSETLALEKISDWAEEAVTQAIALGLVPNQLQRGYRDAITRAEFCALAVTLYETATGEQATGRSSFVDTTDVNIERAAYLGIVSGVGDNRFLPDAELNREQAAKILSNLSEVLGNSLSSVKPTFADNAQISGWALDAVGQVQSAGIMNGTGGNQFTPHGSYTREQSIITMLNLYRTAK